MKRFVSYSIAFIFIVSVGNIQSQDNSPIYISANYKNKPLVEILTELESQYEIRFSYLDQVVQNKRITATMKNKALPEALKVILQGTNLSFQVFDPKNIVIFKEAIHETYSIQGWVTDQQSGEGLPFANVIIPSLGIGDAADEKGYYQIEDLASDTYEVRFQVIGYKPFSKTVTLEKNTVLNAELEIQAIEFEAVEITPGIIQITTEEPSTQVLSSEEILSSPNFTKDIYRSIQVLPGISNTDWSAKPHIKGGNYDETAIVLDNMEIQNPFHLEELMDGGISIINTELAKNVKVVTGGYSAKYPDKMSGVIEINSLDAAQDHAVKLNLDALFMALFFNRRISSKANYFLSARRSTFDLVPEVFDIDSGDFHSATVESIKNRYGAFDEMIPVYYDFWNKLDYRPNARHRLTFNALFSLDDLLGVEAVGYFRTEYMKSLRKNFYSWLNWHWLINRNMASVTTIGHQSLSKNAEFTLDLNVRDRNFDRSDVGISTLKQKNLWEIDNRHSLEFGFEVNRFTSDYYFDDIRLNRSETRADSAVIDTILVDTRFSGHTISGYVQDTWRISNKLDFLLGLRISEQSFSDNLQIAPRTAIKYKLNDNLDLKLAYGLYYQPDNYYKLKTYQGQNQPERQPEKSHHYIGSLTYFRNNLSFDLDFYFKDYVRLNDDFEFDIFDRSTIAALDIPLRAKKGTSAGFDCLLRGHYGKGNMFSISYSYSKNDVTDDQGLTRARSMDRRHSLAINKVFKVTDAFTVGALWRFHTGDPYTPATMHVWGDSPSFIVLPITKPERKTAPDIRCIILWI